MNGSPSQPPPLPPGAAHGSNPPLPEQLDPRLNAFWQQAQALVALEHGLTPACQVKLATLAHELQLSDDEFQQSLARLRAPAEPVAPPSALDQHKTAFRDYVDKKLAKLPTPMLDASREDRLIKQAAERYQLDASSAQQVVAAAAAHAQVRRIDRAEARQIVANMVAEKVGEAVWLEHAAAERLSVAGQTWGLSSAEVEQLIQDHTAGNRRRVVAERRRTMLLIGGSVTIVIAIVVTAVGVALSRREKTPTVADVPPVDLAPETASETTKPSARRTAAPAWWDSRLAVAVTQARTWYRSFRSIYEALAAPEPETRANGYERVVAWANETGDVEDAERPPAALARDMVLGVIVGEPDAAAARRLATALVAPIISAAERGPRTTPDIHLALWALETSVQALGRKDLTDERAQSLRDAVATALDARVDPTNSTDEIRRAWSAAFARQVLRHAARRATTDASAALEWLDAIREAAGTLPPEEFQRLQIGVATAAVPAAGEQWTTWQPILHEGLESRDPLLLAPIIELYERAGNAPWRGPLGDMIRQRTGVPAETQEPAELARAARQALGLAATTSTLPVDVWNQLRAPVDELFARDVDEADPAALLARAAEVAHWTTLAAAAAHGDLGRHVWDATWREGPPKRNDAGKPEDGGPKRPDLAIFDPRGGPRPPSDPRLVNQRRQQAQQFGGALEHHDRLDPRHRLNILRGLAMLAAEVPDVSPAHGQNIARYLLSSRTEIEAREMLDYGRVVVEWRSVQLGLADHLGNTKASNVYLAELVSRALGRSVTEDEATNGRAALRRELLEHALAESSGAGTRLAREQQATLGASAEETAALLHANFVRRAQLWQFDASTLSAEPAPGVIVAALARHVAARQIKLGIGSDLDRRWLDDFGRRAVVADYQAISDLHRLVAWEQLFVRLSAQEVARLHPDHGAAAAALVTRELDATPLPRTLLSQLVRLETLQLRLWMLAAVAPRSRT